MTDEIIKKIINVHFYGIRTVMTGIAMTRNQLGSHANLDSIETDAVEQDKKINDNCNVCYAGFALGAGSLGLLSVSNNKDPMFYFIGTVFAAVSTLGIVRQAVNANKNANRLFDNLNNFRGQQGLASLDRNEVKKQEGKVRKLAKERGLYKKNATRTA